MWWAVLVVVCVLTLVVGKRMNRTPTLSEALTFVSKKAPNTPLWAETLDTMLQTIDVDPPFTDLSGLPTQLWPLVQKHIRRAELALQMHDALIDLYPDAREEMNRIVNSSAYTPSQKAAIATSFLSTLLTRARRGSKDTCAAEFIGQMRLSKLIYFQPNEISGKDVFDEHCAGMMGSCKDVVATTLISTLDANRFLLPAAKAHF